MKSAACSHVGILLGLLLVGGCTLPIFGEQAPTQYFVLTSLPETEGARLAASSNDEIAVGVSPVDVPTYLDRPQIVTRSSSNEIVLSQYHVWASPLRGNFERVMAVNLGVLIPTRRAFVLPFRRAFPLDYEIRMTIDRFERLDDGSVVLEARWVTLVEPNERVVVVRDAQIRIPDVSNDYSAIVAAMSKAVADLSREVASDIQSAESARGKRRA